MNEGPTHTSSFLRILIPVSRTIVWAGATMLALVFLCVLLIAILGWNWLRAPLEQFVLQKSGRVLAIQGDLKVNIGWPIIRLQAQFVTFANPTWAQQKQMLSAQGVEVGMDLTQLFQRKVVFPEVHLAQADIALERSREGRKSWLLDLGQTDEDARIDLGQVSLERGTLIFEDPSQETRLSATLTTTLTSAAKAPTAGLQFTVKGLYRGLPVQGLGSGGPVLALRDTRLPYPLNVRATAGSTNVVLDGTVTDLQTLSAADLHMTLAGDSLEQLFPLLGIAFPATRPYTTEGHLVHSGNTWRLEKFTGRIGGSDIAGFAQLVTGGTRPQLRAELQSKLLTLDDLGPIIGARPGSVKTAADKPQSSGRVLPDLPFNAERWGSVDADVQLKAATLARADVLPLENLYAHLFLKDSVLTLSPLNFGFAGGQLETQITLNAKSPPIQAHALMRARKLQLTKLFPTLDLGKTSIGQVNGAFDLTGQGESVASMLAKAHCKLSLVVTNGQISRLMMERAGLHLWEIVGLNLTGDRPVKLRCGVADFAVKDGTMQANALVVDTQVTTLFGTGTIDLKTEALDLVLETRTKTTSPLSLQSPIYIRGNFAKPSVQIDKGRVLARAAGALGLGLVNPLLALLPLIDAGPGEDSDCGQLVRDARAWTPKQEQSRSATERRRPPQTSAESTNARRP